MDLYNKYQEAFTARPYDFDNDKTGVMGMCSADEREFPNEPSDSARTNVSQCRGTGVIFDTWRLQAS